MCAAQEPVPGPNAFKYNGKTIAMYPRCDSTDSDDPSVASCTTPAVTLAGLGCLVTAPQPPSSKASLR